ncbi:hypothetical protein [Rhizobium mesoamericanum]|uniref:hypothetical protein n=1 Tax=Rhizobium mesoamericanum TaxID=1079800 RepID=UPI001AEC471F|nr:hypothetical protein [Rhizobium mesoamericanum]
MILEARQRSIVPKGFTGLSLKRCEKEINSLAQQLTKTGSELSLQITALSKAIEVAGDDVVNGRNEDAAKHLEDLRRRQETLKAASGASQ